MDLNYSQLDNFIKQIINEFIYIWQGYFYILFKLFTNSLDKNVCDMILNSLIPQFWEGMFFFFKFWDVEMINRGRNEVNKMKFHRETCFFFLMKKKISKIYDFKVD